jgi:hypothetical protein
MDGAIGRQRRKPPNGIRVTTPTHALDTPPPIEIWNDQTIMNITDLLFFLAENKNVEHMIDKER